MDFALENQGRSVMPDRVLGRELWTCVTDQTVREVYHRLLKRARAGYPVEFSYRCDAPDWRRTFGMSIRGLPRGEVEFVSTLLHAEAREPVRLLEPGHVRDEARVVRICSWCEKAARPDNRWVPVEEAVAAQHLLEGEKLPQVTHGICQECMDRMIDCLKQVEPGGVPEV